MEIVFFIIWCVIALSWLLIFPMDKRIEKLNDNSRLKKWWKKHIVDLEPNEEDSI